jgi:hypothetical protein
MTATANDQLSEFALTLTSLTLTNNKGITVLVLNSTDSLEFIHSNGTASPIKTLSIPQGVYTAATATIGRASFTCVTLNSSGGLDFSTFANGQTPSADVTVNLPSPITIDGSRIGLSLELLVSSSTKFSSCALNGAPFSIRPTFNLMSAIFATQPNNSENGKAFGIRGRVSSIDVANETLTLITPDQLSLTVKTNTGTNFQGIANFNSLNTGMFLDLDTASQPDGSLLATRVAVFDTTATNVFAGPLSFVASSVSSLTILGRQQQGDEFTTQPVDIQDYSFPTGTTFNISGQFTNLQNLPFAATFDGSNIVAGQNIAVFSKAISHTAGSPTSATTLTLLPQTINGTIEQVSSSGTFSVYTINLAPYDLFPALAVQPGQTSLLQNPSVVQVYVDGNTQLLNANSLAPGNVMRFYGLVFNDSGVLRMDCSQVNDGVAP